MTPLISRDELAQLLASNAGVVILDARASSQQANVDVHLSSARAPGADPARGGRHPLPPIGRWTRQLGDWGIDPETHVVIFDDQFGANAAARAWWMLRAVGHERVQVLDGGIAALELPTNDVAPKPPYPASRWLRPTVDLPNVDRTNYKILDVRSRERYRGETEPIDPIAGHIPGAHNLPFAENLDNGRFKSPHALREMYEQFLGDTPIEKLVVHCGSGVTACHTLLALEAAGLHGASLYVGSWSEWCRNDLPREPS